MNEAYKAAGVDIHAGYRSVELIKDSVKKTFTKGVMTEIGGFGGLFELFQTGNYEAGFDYQYAFNICRSFFAGYKIFFACFHKALLCLFPDCQTGCQPFRQAGGQHLCLG